MSQSSLFPPTDPIDKLRQRFGFTLRKSLVEFEVIAEAKKQGFKHESAGLDEVYIMALNYLINKIK